MGLGKGWHKHSREHKDAYLLGRLRKQDNLFMINRVKKELKHLKVFKLKSKSKFVPIRNAENLIAQHRFDLKSLRKIGEGSDRRVYEIDDNLVIKVAKTKRGLAQNECETDAYLGMLPKLVEFGRDYVIVKRIPRDDKRSNKMLKPLKKFSVFDWDNKTSELQEALLKLDEQYPDSGFHDVMNYDLLWYDFTAGRNWGWKDNKPYLIDAGTLNKSNMFNKKKLDFLTPEWEKIKLKRSRM